MPSDYQQLITATIQHLEEIKKRGVRFVNVSQETLALLNQPVARPATTAPASTPVEPVRPSATLAAKPTRSPTVPLSAGSQVSEPRSPSPVAPVLVTLAPIVPSSAPQPTSSSASAEAPVDKARAMAELRARALACRRCPHLVAARKNVVFGVGDINAALMFVGEAPGADEDAQGEPFVGAAGQKLTQIIQAMGLSRQTVYIANILKCRPDTPGQPYGNRPPTDEEMNTCFPYLLEQIELIKPKAMVALGATAVKGLLHSKIGITKLRGQWQVFHDIPTMPTFHTAYLLRNQAMSEKRKVWEDMLQVMEKLGLPISDKQRGFFLKA